MNTRYPSLRRAKIHRSYTVEEVAGLLGVHKNTVRRWIRSGLKPVDHLRPTILRGLEVSAFLQDRKAKGKRPCGPGEIYCFKCRTPRSPDGGFVDLEVVSPTSGRLVGLCPACGTLLFRQVNPAKINNFRGNLEITIRPAQSRLRDSLTPKLDDDSKGPAQL